MLNGFYNYNNNELNYAENYVYGPGFTLFRELKDSYEYPVFGWYYFNSIDEAATFYELTDEQKQAFITNNPLPKKPARIVTKLSIMRKLHEKGKWDTFKVIMSSMPSIVQDAWSLATEINEEDPLFVENKEGLKTALGLTEEEFSSLFDS